MLSALYAVSHSASDFSLAVHYLKQVEKWEYYCNKALAQTLFRLSVWCLMSGLSVMMLWEVCEDVCGECVRGGDFVCEKFVENSLLIPF